LKIINNFERGDGVDSLNNLFLYSGKITVSEDFTGSIGLSNLYPPAEGDPRVISNYTSADYSGYFYSDNPVFEVVNVGSGSEQYLQLQVHDHEWSAEYSSDDTHHWHTCTRTGCTATDRQEHVFEEGVVVAEPTYFDDGLRTDTCVCGKSKEVTLPKLVDTEPPTGEIIVRENSVKKMLNTLTFGLFFKETKSIAITADDADSGVASVVYHLSSTVLSEDEVLAISDWSEYTDAITLKPEVQLVVYAKITDEAGNVIYLGSDGLVLEYTAPVISGIEDEKVYCAEVTATITDDNLDTVTVNGAKVTLTGDQLILLPTGEPQTIVATDKAGNSTTVTITVYDSHDWDEGIITTAPTAATEGVRTHTCNHCGDIKTEEVAKLPPTIIEGSQSPWQPGAAGANAGLTFRSDASFSDFICVLVDGEVVDPKNYDLKEGSIIVTLKPEFLATLSAGPHTIEIQSTSGIASTEFVIAKQSGDNLPVTGDNSSTLPWFVLLLVSGGMLGVFGVTSKRRKAIQ